MRLKVQFIASPDRWNTYRAALATAFAASGLDVDLRRDHPPQQVDYIVFAPQSGPQQNFTKFSRLRAVLSLWAGVENIVHNDTIQVPLTRMVDSGLAEGMVEWVCGHVLRYHLGMDTQFGQQDGRWTPKIPPLARNRRVGILGLGALGGACASALVGLNFRVSGWSRSPKTTAGVTCHSGTDLGTLLKSSEILILLLPLTPATENILNAENLALLPRGARILNPGRGALIDDDALLAALNSGHIGHATLDVFRTEPLPANHPYWAHPNVTVTPHIASETRADTSALLIADNIRRDQSGEKMRFLVDRKAGY